jgi:hypothetical protein
VKTGGQSLKDKRKLDLLVESFNSRFPIGTPVVVTEGDQRTPAIVASAATVVESPGKLRGKSRRPFCKFIGAGLRDLTVCAVQSDRERFDGITTLLSTQIIGLANSQLNESVDVVARLAVEAGILAAFAACLQASHRTNATPEQVSCMIGELHRYATRSLQRATAQNSH